MSENTNTPTILFVGVDDTRLDSYAQSIGDVSNVSVHVGTPSNIQEQDYDLVLLEANEMDELQVDSYFEDNEFPKTVVSIGNSDWQLSAHCLKMGAIDCTLNFGDRIDLLNLLKSCLPMANLPFGGT